MTSTGFQFNFSSFDATEDEVEPHSETKPDNQPDDATVLAQSQKALTPATQYHPKTCDLSSVMMSDVEIDGNIYRLANIDPTHLETDDEVAALADVISRTDILNGVYEGGLKVWECAIDLVRFLRRQQHLCNARVLELGCGHGIPGIFALKQGSSVVFSDYNREVLQLATYPNVLCNAPESAARAAYFYGDWLSLSHAIGSGSKFDLILTSDTIYTPEVTQRLYQAIQALLSPNGVAVVAAKRYYFGTGGSVQMLKDMVKSDFMAETAEVFEDGVSNIREIVLLRWRVNS